MSVRDEREGERERESEGEGEVSARFTVSITSIRSGGVDELADVRLETVLTRGVCTRRAPDLVRVRVRVWG